MVVMSTNLIKAKFIGVGAAGNKAVIELMNQKVVTNPNDILLLNTTLRDIPTEYQDKAISFGYMQGCGKEREVAKKQIALAISEKRVDFETFVQDKPDTVVIVTSVEGGTGSGASVNIAKYLSLAFDIKVHMFAFCGFEDDIRGLKNTVDWFNELSDQYTIEAISNKKFLTDDGDRESAEALANNEFVKRMRILLGQFIEPSSSNMDERDLYKVATQSGYMTIESCPLGNKLRDKDQFNSLIQDAIANSKSIDTEPSAVRMGIMINTSSKSHGVIDEDFEVLRKQYGKPFERFYHKQSTHDADYIHFIISGMKVPIDYIKETYNRFKDEFDKVDKSKDSFFGRNDAFNTSEGSMFDTATSFVENANELNMKKEAALKAMGITTSSSQMAQANPLENMGFIKSEL